METETETGLVPYHFYLWFSKSRYLNRQEAEDRMNANFLLLF